MLKSIFCGLALTACFNILAAASDKPIKAVGFFISTVSESDQESVTARAKFIRDGKEFDAVEGHEVYPGDVVITDETGGISIAFLDSSAVRLHESTEFVIQPGLNDQPASVQLSYGHASFASSPTARPEVTDAKDPKSMLIVGDGITNLINLGIGSHSSISASTLAKFDILITRDANGNTFTATVAVLKGTAKLNPVNANAVALAFGSQTLMTITNPVTGVTNSQVTLNQGNLTKDQIAALAAKSVADTTVSVSSNGTVTINSVIKNSDGSIAIGKVTQVNGVVTKDSWTTKDSNNKTIATWSESKTSISMSRVDGPYTLKTTVKKPADSGTGTFKGLNGVTYKGVTTVSPKTGTITFTSTPAKDGSKAIYTFDPGLGKDTVTIIKKDGTATQSTVTYLKGNGNRTTTTENGTFANGSFNGDPNSLVIVTKYIGTSPTVGITPDGHVIDQNQPPVTQ